MRDFRVVPFQIDDFVAFTSGGSEDESADQAFHIAEAHGTSTANVANITQTLTWGAFVVDTAAGAEFTISGSDITMVKAGTYKVTCRAESQGNNRQEIRVTLQVNPSGGGWATLTNGEARNYNSRDADHNIGGVNVIHTVEISSAGDLLRAQAFVNADGTSVLRTQNTKIIIEGPYG